MANIRGLAQLLRQRQTYREQWVEGILDQAQALQHIIDDILDVSQMRVGMRQLRPRETDLVKVVATAVQRARSLAPVQALRIEAPGGPLVGWWDADRMGQVIWNLLSNAIKFTPAGGSVALTIRPLEDSVAIEVSDTGIRLAPASLPRVFERFWQADSTSTRSHSGLGLGLALVRHIVELHGGEVRAQSDGPERGSRFTVTLPATRLSAVALGSRSLPATPE